MIYPLQWTGTNQFSHKSDKSNRRRNVLKSEEPILKQTRIALEQKDDVSSAKTKATCRTPAQRRRARIINLAHSINPSLTGKPTIGIKDSRRSRLDNSRHAHKGIESTTTEHSSMRRRYALHALKKSKNRSISMKMRNKMSRL